MPSSKIEDTDSTSKIEDIDRILSLLTTEFALLSENLLTQKLSNDIRKKITVILKLADFGTSDRGETSGLVAKELLKTLTNLRNSK